MSPLRVNWGCRVSPASWKQEAGPGALEIDSRVT